MLPISQITGEKVALEIGLPEELLDFARMVNSGELSGRADVKVRLTADIDLTGHQWTPIGLGKAQYAGRFDGCGHTISAVTIQKKWPGNYGLFGYVTGAIQNVTVTGTIYNRSGEPHSAVGGIVGEVSGGVVRNCAAAFTVDGGGEPLGLFTGGVAGVVEQGGLVQNCRSSARMKNVQAHFLYLGGVAGCVRDSRVEDCAFAISLTAQGGEGQYIQAGDVTGSIQGESALVNCVHWETADGTFFEREEAVT